MEHDRRVSEVEGEAVADTAGPPARSRRSRLGGARLAVAAVLAGVGVAGGPHVGLGENAGADEQRNQFISAGEPAGAHTNHVHVSLI
jgi:hypothetical protein